MLSSNQGQNIFEDCRVQGLGQRLELRCQGQDQGQG